MHSPFRAALVVAVCLPSAALAQAQPLTLDDAIRRIVKSGKAAGILTDEAGAQRWIDLGALFVAVGADVGLLARAADALASKFRN